MTGRGRTFENLPAHGVERVALVVQAAHLAEQALHLGLRAANPDHQHRGRGNYLPPKLLPCLTKIEIVEVVRRQGGSGEGRCRRGCTARARKTKRPARRRNILPLATAALLLYVRRACAIAPAERGGKNRRPSHPTYSNSGMGRAGRHMYVPLKLLNDGIHTKKMGPSRLAFDEKRMYACTYIPLRSKVSPLPFFLLSTAMRPTAPVSPESTKKRQRRGGSSCVGADALIHTKLRRQSIYTRQLLQLRSYLRGVRAMLTRNKSVGGGRCGVNPAISHAVSLPSLFLTGEV